MYIMGIINKGIASLIKKILNNNNNNSYYDARGQKLFLLSTKLINDTDEIPGGP